MRNRTLIAAAAAIAALAAGSLPAAGAGAPTKIIEDPLGDSNFLNDQGMGDGSTGDQTAADAGTVTDLLGVEISNDKKTLTVTFQTEAPPPAETGVGYRLRVNPDEADGQHCLYIEALFPGKNNTLTAPMAQILDACATETTPLEIFGTTVTIQRDAHEAFAKGATLRAPQAQAFLFTGNENGVGPRHPVADTTKIGSDYKLKK